MIVNIEEDSDAENNSECNFENVMKKYLEALDEINSVKSILHIKERKAKRLLEELQSVCTHKWVMDKLEYGCKTTYTCSNCNASTM